MKRIFYIHGREDEESINNKDQNNVIEDFHTYSKQKEAYHQIDKNSLISGKEVNFTIYSHKGLKFREIIKASEKSPAILTPELLAIDEDIVIKASELLAYSEYLESILNSVLFDKDQEKAKAILIKEKTKCIVRDIFNSPENIENIKKASNIVEEMTSNIVNNKEVIFDLISIKTYDYYTYTHSVNVEVLSIGLGAILGLTTNQIFSLGLGAILHDIGKCLIPTEILNKQGNLTRAEFKIISNHVIESDRILRQHKDLPEDALYPPIQHHEKISGMGYPFGLRGNEINPFGRITAIIDCYDALTTERPYKKALTPYQALSMIISEKGSYDQKLVEIFIKMLGKVI